MTARIKKRFIAGARCPACQQLDSLVIYIENNVEKMECVQCGHHETHAEQKVKQASRQQESVIGVFKPE